MTCKSIAIIATLLFGVALAARVSTAQEIEKGQRGEAARRAFTINYGFSQQEEDDVKARARQCIWESWQRRRPAHCAVIWTNIEGEPTTHNFYVNHGEGGRLRVFLEITYRCCWHSGMEGKEPKTESMSTTTYQIVERIDVMSNRVVPDKVDRQPHTYALRFKEDASVKDNATTILLL
jgi:hypothetical protein